MSALLRQVAWGKADDESGGLRDRLGKWLLKQSLRLIPVEQLRAFHWRPNGYTRDDEDKKHVVISDNPVRYWGNFDRDIAVAYAVRHDEDGILGVFWQWDDARDAASVLSQHYDDYHFREYVHNVDAGRIQTAEDEIDGLEQNLSVEKLPLYRTFDFDAWPDDATMIRTETVRTVEDVREAEGLSASGGNGDTQ